MILKPVLCRQSRTFVLYIKPLDLSSYGTTIAKARQMMGYCINDYLQNEMDLKSKLKFYKKYGHGIPNQCKIVYKYSNSPEFRGIKRNSRIL